MLLVAHRLKVNGVPLLESKVLNVQLPSLGDLADSLPATWKGSVCTVTQNSGQHPNQVWLDKFWGLVANTWHNLPDELMHVMVVLLQATALHHLPSAVVRLPSAPPTSEPCLPTQQASCQRSAACALLRHVQTASAASLLLRCQSSQLWLPCHHICHYHCTCWCLLAALTTRNFRLCAASWQTTSLCRKSPMVRSGMC